MQSCVLYWARGTPSSSLSDSLGGANEAGKHPLAFVGFPRMMGGTSSWPSLFFREVQKKEIAVTERDRQQPQGFRARWRKGWNDWKLLSLYGKFEHAVVFVLTVLIALTVLLSLWNLLIKVVGAIIAQGTSFDPTNYAVFQAVFGMIFTVVIALEFKRSLLVTIEQRFSIIQVRTIILIAILAIVRKFIIIDIKTVEAAKLLALAAAILALGIVYWLAGDRADRERRIAREEREANRRWQAQSRRLGDR